MKHLNGGVFPEHVSVTWYIPFLWKRRPHFLLPFVLTIFFSGPLHLFLSDCKTPKITVLHYFCLYVNKYNYVMKIYHWVLVDFSDLSTVFQHLFPKFWLTFKTKFYIPWKFTKLFANRIIGDSQWYCFQWLRWNLFRFLFLWLLTRLCLSCLFYLQR